MRNVTSTRRLRRKYRQWFTLFLALAVVIVGTRQFVRVQARHSDATVTQTAKQTPQVKPKPKAKPVAARQSTATPVADWTQPSEKKPYPVVSAHQPLTLEVSLAKQRVYVKAEDRVLYTMFASTGMNDSTPHGTFTIQDRGESFYNPNERMGANYWTAFLGTVYLFHSVPTDIDGAYILSEAQSLGKKPSSHGCVRLSVPDARWINETVPDGTKVVIA